MEDLIEKYDEYLKEYKQLSINTLDAYISDVLQFKTYLDNIGPISLLEVNKTHIITYLMFLQKENMAVSTINRILSSLRCFYQYLLNNKMICEDPTFNLKAPQYEKKLPNILTLEEVDLFLSLPQDDKFKGARDKAMLELLYGTGMGVSEIVSLNLDNIDLDIGYVNINKSKSNERVIPIGKIALECLENYIYNFRDCIVDDKNEKALFVNYRGKRLTRQGFWKIVKQYTKKSGIAKKITPQILRHSFAVHLLQNGADLKTVQEILGHSDISTTNFYFSFLKDTPLRDIYKKTHPRA